MTRLEYFKLQAKNLFSDYKTKKPFFDKAINDYLYEYNPKYFDIDEIICAYDIDEDNFSLMKAQHIIALMVGFNKWADLSKASEADLELAKLLLDNRDEISIEDWEMYVADVERSIGDSLDPESKLELFKRYLNGGFSEDSLN